MAIKNLNNFVHEKLQRYIKVGDIVIDATVGNGFDTAFLAEAVSASGKVYGFDIQEEAINRTKQLLKEKNLFHQVELLNVGHQYMLETLRETVVGKVSVVMFNLGYLPRGDKRIVTRADSTVAALEASLKLIRPGGVISVMAYRGHAGGREEYETVEKILGQSALYDDMKILATSDTGPVWLLVEQVSQSSRVVF